MTAEDNADAVERLLAMGTFVDSNPQIPMATDHVWARCDHCGEGTMRPKTASPKRCVVTPGCNGLHRQ